jgi:MoxR-like ATPase
VSYPFNVLDEVRTAATSDALLAQRPFVEEARLARRAVVEAQRDRERPLTRMEWEARYYVPTPGLSDAISASIAVGQPLLLTGEPGVGKTQAAFYTAWRLGLEPVIEFQVRSTSVARDLLYEFDAVRYFHAANREGEPLPDRFEFINEGPLWRVLAAHRTSVLLIDEIDKAPRDFPNDLLHELDQMRFTVEILGKDHPMYEQRGTIERRPIVFITSNGERQLPEPFLRRCVYFHIEFRREDVRAAIDRRSGVDPGLPNLFPNLADGVREAALDRFLELRARGLAKPPSLGELLVWLRLLNARDVKGLDDEEEALSATVLLKDLDDLRRRGAAGGAP